MRAAPARVSIPRRVALSRTAPLEYIGRDDNLRLLGSEVQYTVFN